MRIVSLLPSATEILFAVGAGPQVVGVTHECDHPAAATSVRAVTRDLLPPGLDAAEIDAAVSAGIRDDHTIYALDADALTAVAPDVVVAQELCDVCAVPVETVGATLCTVAPAARVVAADPHTLDDLSDAILAVGRAVDAEDGARRLVADLDARLDVVRAAVAGRRRPRVAVLEWPDPPWLPGHWVPDMVDVAGGEGLLGTSGEPSTRACWEDLDGLDVEVVVAAFCGFDLATTRGMVDDLVATPHGARLVDGVRVLAVDGSALFSRPGPRLVDGVEVLAHALHGTGPVPAADAAAELVDGSWQPVEAPA